jgi:hypothetical protein
MLMQPVSGAKTGDAVFVKFSSMRFRPVIRYLMSG